MKKIIETEYPGFHDKTDKYDFEIYANKIIQHNSNDTFKALALIVDHFNDRHLQVYTPKKYLHIDTSKCHNDLAVVLNHLGHDKLFGYEGIWVNDYCDCVIGMSKVSNSSNYQAIVVEDRNGYLLPGQQLGSFEKTKHQYYITDYTSPYSGGRYFVRTTFRSDTILTTGADGKWYKVTNYKENLLRRLPEYQFKASSKLVNKDNYIIKIPVCSRENAVLVDSIIKVDSNTILKTRNLIIDIRNNLGGTSESYRRLIPFAYTNPILQVRRYLYCTESDINNKKKDFDAYIKRGSIDSQYIESYQYYINLERDSLGKFVLYPADTITSYAILEYPKNIGIIVNYACQSAAELLILTFNQSKKVTVFGEHTMGAVDYLDYYPIDLPSRKYKLYIPTTKRYVPKNEGNIDGKGIFPQVPISDNNKDWVDFVIKYYEKR